MKDYNKFNSITFVYNITCKCIPYVAILSTLLITIGSIWGIFFSPTDYQQGHSFRIIYIHVPTSFLAQSVYLLLSLAGIIKLMWNIKIADLILHSAAPIGAWMTVIALVSGAIWGKPVWGTWWVWDARLTSMLILLFLYFGIIVLGYSISNNDNASKACSVLAIVGGINIPIIKYSVEWWNTLHQAATFTITKHPKMPIEMWMPLLIMVIGVYCFFLFTLLLRIRLHILKYKDLYKERYSYVRNS